MAEPEITKLGKYEITSTLGKGAMGVVYKGYDRMLDRYAAIKTIRPDLQEDDEESTQGRQRFEREAIAAARIAHNGIVSVYEFGEDNGITFIAMEFVSGRTLKDFFDKEERFPIETAGDIMIKCLDALDHAHSKGVIHRDIKPANIIVDDEGNPKIMDFGIARIETSTMTQVGTVLGTPSYMSPEQFMGQIVDKRADIFSCGAMFYQMLTGDKPFSGSITTIMQKVLNEMPTPPSTLNPHMPAHFDQVINKAMAKRPGDRFQSAKEFADGIRKALAGQSLEEDDDEGTLVASAAAPGAVAAPDEAEDEATMVDTRPRPPAGGGAQAAAPKRRAPVEAEVQGSSGGGKFAAVAIAAVLMIAVIGAAVWFLVIEPGMDDNGGTVVAGNNGDGSNGPTTPPPDTTPPDTTPVVNTPPDTTAPPTNTPPPDATPPPPPPDVVTPPVTPPPVTPPPDTTITQPVNGGTTAPVNGGTTTAVTPPISTTPDPPPPPPPPRGPEVTISSDHGDVPTIGVGTPINFTMRVSEPAHMFCFYQAGAGNVTRMWPNAFNANFPQIIPGQPAIVFTPDQQAQGAQLIPQDAGTIEIVTCGAALAEGNPAQRMQAVDAAVGGADFGATTISDIEGLRAQVEAAIGAPMSWSNIYISVN